MALLSSVFSVLLAAALLAPCLGSHAYGGRCSCDDECAPSVIRNYLSQFFNGVTSVRNDGTDEDLDDEQLGVRLGISVADFEGFLASIADPHIVYYAGVGAFEGIDAFTDPETGYAASISQTRRGALWVMASAAVAIDGHVAEVDYWLYRRVVNAEDPVVGVDLFHGKQYWRRYDSSAGSGSSESSSSSESKSRSKSKSRSESKSRSGSRDSSSDSKSGSKSKSSSESKSRSGSRDSSDSSSSDEHHGGYDHDKVCAWKLETAGFEGQHLYRLGLGDFAML